VAFSADRKTIILPPESKPGGNYSPGILVGDTLYVSGQAGEDAAGKIPGDFDAESEAGPGKTSTTFSKAAWMSSDVKRASVLDGWKACSRE